MSLLLCASVPRAAALALVLSITAPTAAKADPDDGQTIVVTAGRLAKTIEQPPNSTASIDRAHIAETVNAVNVEDTLKYLPSLVVRKRHIGDTQAPLATRTSGLGASARSLIFADGVLLSSLIGNNNTSASPRWSMISPEEIERIDVLYGPFSAAYAGNSIGAVVNITTRLPDKLEGTLTAGTSVQTFDQYATRGNYPAYQIGATLGDRFGPLALFGSATHTVSNSQPLTYVTGVRPAMTSATGTQTTGGFDDLNRTAQAIRVFGASGLEHQRQDNIKFKAALDLSPSVRLTYVGGLFLNDTNAAAQTYLTPAANGAPVYAATTPANIAGYNYTIPASAFDGGVYHYDERHWSHALSATGTSHRFDWQVIGSLYDFDKDVQRSPTGVLPAAFDGGPGTITRLDGTGWQTLDAKAAWRADDAASNTLSAGAHVDRFEINSNRYTTTDWIAGSEGAINQISRGKTRTVALWAQDVWKIAPAVALTVGGRYEWWRAYGGVNFPVTLLGTTGPSPTPYRQPTLSAAKFSPKGSLAWTVGPAWTVRASIGQAYRFPTVGELYQVVMTPVPALPNPNLRPENALSEELAFEYHDAQGTLRLSLFNESIRDALISQSGPLPVTPVQIGTFVQNVGRTRARGVEFALVRTDFPVRRVDLSGSATYTDATTRADAAFPAAIGKLLPSVPHWKATGVITWRPVDAVSLTAAARYASRNYGALDNSDVIGNTYQGFYQYFVVDLRAVLKVTDRYAFAIGVDNVNDNRYFLFHPFPQRSFSAEASYRF